MTTFDYRAARDVIFGIVRHEDSDKIKEIIRTTATTSERALLLALVEFAPNIEPSTATLAGMMAVDTRSVRRLIGSCKRKGLLDVESRPGLGRDATNRYTLLYPGHTVPPDDMSPRTESAPTPDKIGTSPRTVRPPKQTIKAGNEADKDPEPFRLEGSAPPVAGSRKAKTGKAAKAKRPEQATPPGAHEQVADCYFEAFKAQHGRDPVFGGAEGAAVKRLLVKLKGDGAEACRRVRNAFTTFRAGSVTILDIAHKPDAFASAEVPKGGMTVQRGPHDADLVARLRAEGAAEA